MGRRQIAGSCTRLEADEFILDTAFYIGMLLYVAIGGALAPALLPCFSVGVLGLGAEADRVVSVHTSCL
jgi:hypothetical protein